MDKWIEKYKAGLLLLLMLLAVYFPLFLHLDYMPFRMWDESILGTNAIGMLNNHNYIVTYFNGSPDMSNCKPPLMIWCMVFFSKILGFSELSLRLPSAIAGLILCIYLYFSIKKYTNSSIYGFITVLVLVTCQGYIRNHVTRTGEYDSLLVLFSTIAALNIFFAVQANEKQTQSKHIFIFFLFLTLATLTKGIAFFMQAPGLFIYVLANKKVVSFLKNKWFYAGFFVFLLFGIGYYFLRESMNAGYIQAVWENELGGRFGGVIDGHPGPVSYYINEITTWQFTVYLAVFPIGLFAAFIMANRELKKLVAFAFVNGLFFLFFISIASTKLPHYDAPLFPYLAIITASFFYLLYTTFKEKLLLKYGRIVSAVFAFAALIAMLSPYYQEIVQKVYFPKGDSWEESFSVSCRFFQQVKNGKLPRQEYNLVLDIDSSNPYGTNSVLRCYMHEMAENNIPVKLLNMGDLKPNQTIVVFSAYKLQQIQALYNVKVLSHLDKCNADVVLVQNNRGLALVTE